MLESLVYLFLLFAVPDFSVQWATPKQKEVTVKVNPEIQRDLIKIVSDGLRVKYRIQLKLCFKRSAWFDHCFDERKQVNEIKFDPVSENYLVTTDLFDDGADPKVESFTDFEQALIAFSSVDGIEIRSLNRDRPLRTKDLNSGRFYIRVRVVSSNVDRPRDAFDWISYLVTIGAIDRREHDSGWTDFDLVQRK